jgi:hypothetical protein
MAADQRFLTDAIPQLKDYLLSNEVFWSLGKDPQLTLGNVLLAQASLDGAEAEKTAIAAHKKEWHSAWQKKAEKEFGTRLRLWTEYLSELSEKPSRHAGYYASEVRNRVLMELLAGEVPALKSQLAPLDARVKALLSGDDFLWGEELKSKFPKSGYWFLYGNPSTS